MDTGDPTSATSGDQPRRPLDPADFAPPPFARVRMREGYDIGEVDRFALLLDAAVRQPSPGLSAQDIENLRFTPVRIRQGYDMAQVDEWLDHVAVTLSARERSPASVEGALDLAVFDPPDFGVVKLREGYDMAEVQAFAEGLRAKVLEVPPAITAEEVEHVRFTPVQLHAAYDMAQVDAWLDRVAAELRR